MMPLLVDSGYWIALESLDDQNHLAALNYWQRLKADMPMLLSTTYIFDEVVTFFNSRQNHAKAVEIGNILLSSSFVEMIEVDSQLFEEGWRYFERHKDKHYSFTDCVSFGVMNDRMLETALSFDRHFKQAGFKTLP